MIDLLIDNTIKSGVLTVKDNSYNLPGITRGVIKIAKLGFERTLDGASTPTIVDFLNPSLSSFLTVTAKIDEVIDVEYTLMTLLVGAAYSNGTNRIDKVGIYNESQKYSHVITNNKAYEIDRDASSANILYLKTPLVDGTTTMYLALLKTECVPVLYNIPKLLKTLTLSQGDCQCKNCGSTLERITKAHRYIEALGQSTEDDCAARKNFMQCLKEMFELC